MFLFGNLKKTTTDADSQGVLGLREQPATKQTHKLTFDKATNCVAWMQQTWNAFYKGTSQNSWEDKLILVQHFLEICG